MLLKLAVVGFCLGSLAPTMAVAAPANTPKAHSTLNLDSAKKALESGDEARALAALDEIELSADRRAAPLVEALLGRGANSKLLLRAIGVAGALGAPERGAGSVREAPRSGRAPCGRAKLGAHQGQHRRQRLARRVARQRPGLA